MSNAPIRTFAPLAAALAALLLGVAPSATAAPPATAASDSEAARLAPLLDGMGSHRHSIATDVPLAQRYFDQGLVLAYGFNHAEAARAFREALRLDPACAMCAWGVALVLGPNINAAMDPAGAPEAWAALETARVLVEDGAERERAYVAALARRYAPQPPESRAALDAGYADAMRELARRYPDDLDAATLFAEALMDTTPWDYWTADGEPKPVTKEILAVLEAVLAKDPDHPGANHLYIHVVEAVHPERGVAAADRLGSLVPAAGHLVHMPGHIYIRVGRYHDAEVANERAIAADASYESQCHAQGLYPLTYVPHNYHFLGAAATFAGRGKVALEAARHIAAHADPAMMREKGFGTLQHYWATPLYTLVRFGRWDEILAEPQPPGDLLYPTGVWRYARGMAGLRKGRLADGDAELAALRRIAADPGLEGVTLWDINPTRSLLEIAAEVLGAELAAARDDFDGAIAQLESAVRREGELRYDEPPPWPFPVRHTLGSIFLRANRLADAERVYREDLAKFPENGWSLLGLAQSLESQGYEDEAAPVRERFAKAWQYADVEITGSEL